MANKTSYKMLKVEIIKMLPDDFTYIQKCKLFEELAEEYRAKSRKEVYGSTSKSLKAEDYSPIVKKA